MFCLALACYPCRMLVAWDFWIFKFLTPPRIPALETPRDVEEEGKRQ